MDEAIGSANEKVRGAGANTGEVTLKCSVRFDPVWTRGRSRPYIEDRAVLW
jgi:hypothetical protein